MEFFENQVGEVRYLTTLATDTPTPLSPGSSSAGAGAGAGAGRGHHSHHNHNHAIRGARTPSVESPGPGITTGAKRKSSAGDDGSPGSKSHAAQQRSKRNRYISIACNECKRRKIKCNGETPCQRCGNLNLQCLYAPNCCTSNFKDSDEFKHMAKQVSQLQEQVDTLCDSLSSIRSEALRLAPIQDRVLPLPSASSTPSISSAPSIPSAYRAELVQPRQPGFRGPTSTRYSLDVAKNTLHQMGYSTGNPISGVEVDGALQETPTASPIIGHDFSSPPSKLHQDVLWEFDKDELVRLCRLYEEEVGLMWPVITIEPVIAYAKNLATWMEAAKKNGLTTPFGQDGGINDYNSLLLKVVLCNVLCVEEHGNSDRGQRLFESLRPITDRMLMSDESNVKNMPILALVAGYYFLSAEEVLSWRTMGQVARLCFELGLHRRDTIARIENEEDRRNAVHTFWTAYVLDRRWAFATGLPFVVPDEEIDPDLPYPDNAPFLVAMITYSRLSAKVWRFVRHSDPKAVLELRTADIEDLDRRIKQWYTEVPREAQLELSDWEVVPRYLTPPVSHQQEYNIQRLQIWTYLRLNQIRTWLYMPILHTHSSIMENLRHAECAVKLAKNTIRYLTHLNNTTNIYRRMQYFYHQFLSSAITVLFLASCHAPVNFSSSCRDEFYMAMDLVKYMSSKSFVSKRLWTTIKSLRDVAPRLGLAEDPHSTAALTMAGLASGQRQQQRPTPPNSTTTTTTSTVSTGGFGPPTPLAPGSSPGAHSGVLMSNEMSRIFEGYVDQGQQASEKNGNLAPPSSRADGGIMGGGGGGGVGGQANGGSAVPFGSAGAGNGSVYQAFKDMM